MYKRKLNFKNVGKESFFLWGARQTGKTTLLRHNYPDALWFDLLLSDVYEQLIQHPEQVREVILAGSGTQTVVIDEIQKIPRLLDEVHWLIENVGAQFILSGSSARKIIRTEANLLGGRALRFELYPLTSAEIPNFDLLRALNHGMLPRHYLSDHPERLISAYIGNYLRDEIMAEARIRNIGAFSRFLEAVAFSNGEMVNYTNIASDCGVSAPTVREYFQILEDTLTGRFLPSFQRRSKRRVITAPKFYFFDVGLANYLVKRGRIIQGSESYGKAFEHFIYQELYAHSQYSGLNYPISYWRTASQIETDFVLGNGEVVVEVKSTNHAGSRHLKGLRYFSDEYRPQKSILVSNDKFPRKIDNLSILPWKTFLDQLWGGSLIG